MLTDFGALTLAWFGFRLMRRPADWKRTYGFDRFQVPLSIDGIRVYLPADNRLDFARFLTPDVAQVQDGQQASFTVSAWAGRRYPASVTRVAYGSTLTDNVVTYLTWLDIDNSDLSLRPAADLRVNECARRIAAGEVARGLKVLVRGRRRFRAVHAGGDLILLSLPPASMLRRILVFAFVVILGNRRQSVAQLSEQGLAIGRYLAQLACKTFGNETR